jgi:hypothetical protein
MIDMKKIKECPDCGAQLQFASGCYFCPQCGAGQCGKTISAFVITLLCLAVVVLA